MLYLLHCHTSQGTQSGSGSKNTFQVLSIVRRSSFRRTLALKYDRAPCPCVVSISVSITDFGLEVYYTVFL